SAPSARPPVAAPHLPPARRWSCASWRSAPSGRLRPRAGSASTWSGCTGRVWFRTRSLAGRWSGWQRADADAQPDAGSAEARADHGWQLGSPVWTGPSDAIRYRLTGGVRRLRAYFVRSPAVRSPLRRVSVARSPPIVPRSAWDTTDLPRRGKRRYAPAVR